MTCCYAGTFAVPPLLPDPFWSNYCTLTAPCSPLGFAIYLPVVVAKWRRSRCCLHSSYHEHRDTSRSGAPIAEKQMLARKGNFVWSLPCSYRCLPLLNNKYEASCTDYTWSRELWRRSTSSNQLYQLCRQQQQHRMILRIMVNRSLDCFLKLPCEIFQST